MKSSLRIAEIHINNKFLNTIDEYRIIIIEIEKFDYKIIDYNNLWRYDIVVKGGYKHENYRM